MSKRPSESIVEYGDFQTPTTLARDVCELLTRQGVRPAAILEPTCGVGRFVCASMRAFPCATHVVGIDINAEYVKQASSEIRNEELSTNVKFRCESFFNVDWDQLIANLPEPILVIGNPPWVTNARLGVLGSSNLPDKSNFHGRSGFDAITGKSNFDISEWMLMKLLGALDKRAAHLAMLCKTAVARKALLHAWKSGIMVESSSLHSIDSKKYFDASVDACLLCCRLGVERREECSTFPGLRAARATGVFGFRDGRVVADLTKYDATKTLHGDESGRWRSGMKHDCSKVMELRKNGDAYRNGYAELVELEDEYVFPLLKSSDLANDSSMAPRNWVIVTQRTVGEPTNVIKTMAPRTWRYLQAHAEVLDGRASSIYRNRPRFSVFGVGPYSFAPWKVAISGFYKALRFVLIGSIEEKPIMIDDTCYSIPLHSRQAATYLVNLLNGEVAQGFFTAHVFWDNKRPITIDLLRRLNLVALARQDGTEEKMRGIIDTQAKRYGCPPVETEQAWLFAK